LKLQFAGISSAGWATSIALQNLGIAFDMGVSAEFNLRCGIVLISHAHLDHIHALDIHILRRSLSGCTEPVLVICPPGDYEFIKRRLSLLKEDLQSAYELKAVEPGLTFPLKGNLRVAPFKTLHTELNSQGYVVYEVRQKLLPALQGVPGPTLAQMKARGEQITEELLVPLVTYTGDTTPLIWNSQNSSPEKQFALRAAVKITECTYIGENDTIEEALRRGHTHSNQLGDFVQDNCLGGQSLILHHFSRKYSNGEIRYEIKGKEGGPFGSLTHLIYPDDKVWEIEVNI